MLTVVNVYFEYMGMYAHSVLLFNCLYVQYIIVLHYIVVIVRYRRISNISACAYIPTGSKRMLINE